MESGASSVGVRMEGWEEEGKKEGEGSAETGRSWKWGAWDEEAAVQCS